MTNKVKRFGPARTPTFKQFSLVVSARKPFAREYTGNTIFVVLSKKIKIPFFDTYAGSDGDKIPMDFQNPNEWNGEWHGYIMYNTLTGETVLHDATEFQKYEPSWNGNSDAVSSQMRRLLGLAKIK
jgi:hypothetical protein